MTHSRQVAVKSWKGGLGAIVNHEIGWNSKFNYEFRVLTVDYVLRYPNRARREGYPLLGVPTLSRWIRVFLSQKGCGVNDPTNINKQMILIECFIKCTIDVEGEESVGVSAARGKCFAKFVETQEDLRIQSTRR